jgi:D-alanine-D-alanine ligase
MKQIAIVAGGDSSEYEVSLRSAQGVYGFIDESRYDRYIVTLRNGDWKVQMPDGTRCEVDKNDFSFRAGAKKIKFDYAYITIHGRPGEDGRLQGYFDLLAIPYSSCGVLASALTCNKYMNNRFLKSQGYLVADSIRLVAGRPVDSEALLARLGLPLFVKPNDGGSSFGITKVKDASQLEEAIEKAFAESAEVIAERFVAGREVTCGCYKTRTKQVVLPITEVVTDNEFFDYAAKYDGQVKKITPARLPAECTARIQRQTLDIYDLIGAHGLIRIDYILPPDQSPVLLEINTTPGMTATSFIPQQVRAAGLEMREVMTELIENR